MKNAAFMKHAKKSQNFFDTLSGAFVPFTFCLVGVIILSATIQEESMNKTALIMIDMQRGFIDPSSPICIAGAAGTVPACAEAIRFFHKAKLPVFYAVRHYRGGKPLSETCDESMSDAFPEEFEVLDCDRIMIKPRFSAFFATSLDLVLRRLGVQTVVLAGTTTPNCIRTTCYDALSLDYDVVVLSDCTSSVTPEVQRTNLEDMQRIGAEIMTLDEIKNHG